MNHLDIDVNFAMPAPGISVWAILKEDGEEFVGHAMTSKWGASDGWIIEGSQFKPTHWRPMYPTQPAVWISYEEHFTKRGTRRKIARR